MVALATQADLTRFGYTIPANADALLDRASVRVRLAAGHQTITADTSTVTMPANRDGKLRLWQFPATAVLSVTDDAGNVLTDYELIGQELWLVRHFTERQRGSFLPRQVTVVYSHGFAVLPDELVELVCAVAMRLSGTKPDRDPAIQAQTVGDVSQMVNPAALDMASGLLPGEVATIRRIFYKRG